ncbi:hypothetical protein L3X38_024452 [Prunus dulcis]|uniref:UDP-Glycosyltransferase superfamily protein n=1 Tax=Prunus dulcis TaxID=3755 RepID=A0AAD4VZU6_PRUDU|nr:hypothetical protein L3X38_024452 [Prunus dulcis]
MEAIWIRWAYTLPKVHKCITESDVFYIRTCREIKGHFYDYLSAHHKRPMLLTGPVYGLEDSNKNSPPLEDMWAKWLGGFEEAGTVVFCALGSQLILENDQFQELVLGFKLTGLTFFCSFQTTYGLCYN